MITSMKELSEECKEVCSRIAQGIKDQKADDVN